MQTRVLKLAGSSGALALLWALSGSAASAQAPPAGTLSGGSASSSGASQFAEMKVSIDTDGGRLVEVVPQLLKSVGAEYIIDAEVKNALITSHLANVKLQTALDVLVRVSTIPVQVSFEKGVYRFSKKAETVEAPPETTPMPSLRPGDSVLPPPPEVLEGEVDIHNVQTFDLLRVLNGLSGGSASLGAYDSVGSLSGYSSYSGSGTSPSGYRSGGGSSILGGSGSSSQNGGGGLILNIIGHQGRSSGR